MPHGGGTRATRRAPAHAARDGQAQVQPAPLRLPDDLPAVEPGDRTVRHLYVHVPFCPTVCPYCDFHALERRAGAVEAYLDELDRDAGELAGRYAVELDTVYLGGGTPSFLRDRELERLVGTVRSRFGWGQEATLEVNPGTVTPERAAHWRSLGFGRASVGVQSLQDPVLRYLGRTHDAAQARGALETLIAAGFRVSADAITAVPGQDVERDLGDLAGLGLDHVSAYTLTVEEGTPFHQRGVSVAPEAEERSFELAERVLREHGLERYEVSNHARRGFESRHNRAYWDNRHYLGLGPGAAGHYPTDRPGVASERRTNPHLNAWLDGQRGEVEAVAPEDFLTDGLFAGLRTRRGADLDCLSARAGLDARERFAQQLESLVERGLLELDGPFARATPDGLWVLNQVVSEFL